MFQRRKDGSVDFYRNWKAYKKGFGSPSGEFWLGLEKLHQWTKTKPFELRIDITTTKNARFYAKYRNFRISSERDGYRLQVGAFSGTRRLLWSAGRRGLKFTTFDRDNDLWRNNCAKETKGAWWYANCFITNGNGIYTGKGNARFGTWMTPGRTYPLRFMEMKMRPM